MVPNNIPCKNFSSSHKNVKTRGKHCVKPNLDDCPMLFFEELFVLSGITAVNENISFVGMKHFAVKMGGGDFPLEFIETYLSVENCLFKWLHAPNT